MLSLIAAMTNDRVIGRDGRLPWRLPHDLAHFRRVTRGKSVVMGRKTAQSLGGPLPCRENYVLSRHGLAPPGFRTASVMDIVNLTVLEDEVMVIGGGEIYELFLPYAMRIYLTRVHWHYPGDTFFPVLPSEWELVETETWPELDFEHWKRGTR